MAIPINRVRLSTLKPKDNKADMRFDITEILSQKLKKVKFFLLLRIFILWIKFDWAFFEKEMP